MFFLLSLFVEIAGLLIMGQLFGVALTLLWVFVSFIGGLWIIRYEGLNYMRQMVEAAEPKSRSDRIETMVEDGMLPVLGGLLIAIPGPVTDLCGLFLLIGPLRRLWLSLLNKRGNIHVATDSKTNRIIEGEYKRHKK